MIARLQADGSRAAAPPPFADDIPLGDCTAAQAREYLAWAAEQPWAQRIDPPPNPWAELCQRHPILDRTAVICEPARPAPYDRQHLRQLVSTLREPEYADLLRDVLGDLLAPLIIDIAAAAAQEAHRGRE